MLRGVNPKLLESLDIEVPQDTTTASLAILQNEYKPIAIFEKDEGSNIVNLKVHWLASPSIKDVLSLKAFIENIIKRLSPGDPCQCAYKKTVLERRKVEIEIGEQIDENTIGQSLSGLQARLRSLQDIFKKISKDDSDEHKNLRTEYQQEIWMLEQSIKEKSEALTSIEKDLAAFPEGIPHSLTSLDDVSKCGHCKKEIAVTPLTIISDNQTYDKVCQLVLGIPLEEAGDIMPISQLKYLWAFIVNWVFSIPNNLPTSFLAQIQKALGMIQLSEQMQDVIGLAAETELEAQKQVPNPASTTSGMSSPSGS